MIALALRLIANPTVLIAVGCVFAAGYLVSWGDRHGFNARKVAKIERQLAETNARLSGFVARDAEISAEADRLRQEGYDKALADLKTSTACVVTPEMARAFNRIAQ